MHFVGSGTLSFFKLIPEPFYLEGLYLPEFALEGLYQHEFNLEGHTL
jgi:hypothetical protein